MFSLTLNLGTNGFPQLPDHGSGHSEYIKVLTIIAKTKVVFAIIL